MMKHFAIDNRPAPHPPRCANTEENFVLNMQHLFFFFLFFFSKTGGRDWKKASDGDDDRKQDSG